MTNLKIQIVSFFGSTVSVTRFVTISLLGQTLRVYLVFGKILISLSTSSLHSVWPDWTIFEGSWWQIFKQKYAKCKVTFWAITKHYFLSKTKAWATFGATFRIIWATFYYNIWSHVFESCHSLFQKKLSHFLSEKFLCGLEHLGIFVIEIGLSEGTHSSLCCFTTC